MTIFDALTFIGGLCLFLFGMNLMGQALERRAGNHLQSLLGKLTSKRWMGFLTGLGVTAIIQSSSATTVMVVGFVNSGLMSLGQAINVIMGANVGTTVTAWILSLSGISGDNIIVKLLKPSSFTPILALIGIVFYMFMKGSKKKDTGMILLGFATLMFGMDTMSSAVSGLKDVPAFQELFLLFTNPVLGMLAGALLTAIIQSSSASVGILQALASTGRVSYAAAIPIIMGQNIGTCITALLSSVGTTKNAKRAALVHLAFNVIGTTVWLIVFWILELLIAPLAAFLATSASLFGIAVAHTAFNLLCTALLFPMAKWLERLANILVPDAKLPETYTELDERLLATPPVALRRAHDLVVTMAEIAVEGIKNAFDTLDDYTEEKAQRVRDDEDRTDRYEDMLGTYLVKLSSLQLGDEESTEAAKLLHLIGDFERISDHSVNVIESVEEMRAKELILSQTAVTDIHVLCAAVGEILDLALHAFHEGSLASAMMIEPLEEVIDGLKEEIRARHINRLQQGNCTIEAGFILSDLLTNLERVADHCSNIGACMIDTAKQDMSLHESLREARESGRDFGEQYRSYQEKYALTAE